MSDLSTLRSRVLLVAAATFILFFASFHLFDSPETWMDEGLIIQSAVGLLHTGKAALPVAPGVFEPAWYITTGFPLTLPLAGAFAIFGVSLEAARLVMLVFLLCLYVVLFRYARKAIGGTAAWFGLFLLVFFGPLYGNGRNVLGEIPGLLFMLLALLPFLGSATLTRRRALWVGVCAGCAVAAKPIFLLFVPALLVAVLLRHKELNLKKVVVFGLVGGLVPLVLWVLTQFDQVSLARILAVYANPHDINIGNAVLANSKRFFTEAQPLYFLTALVLWATSYGVRRFRRETIPLTEEILLFFSVLILFAYLRTAGYYRYFFPAQVFALLYVPQSLLYLIRGYKRSVLRAGIIFLSALILFQAYETTFRSWTAVHYDSARTETLKNYFLNLPAPEGIFIYQAPEVVPFAGSRPLYQYAEIIPSVSAGEKYQPLVLSGKAPLVLTPTNLFQSHADDIFSRYLMSENMDSYAILTPKDHE